MTKEITRNYLRQKMSIKKLKKRNWMIKLSYKISVQITSSKSVVAKNMKVKAILKQKKIKTLNSMKIKKTLISLINMALAQLLIWEFSLIFF